MNAPHAAILRPTKYQPCAKARTTHATRVEKEICFRELDKMTICHLVKKYLSQIDLIHISRIQFPHLAASKSGAAKVYTNASTRKNKIAE